MNSLTVNFLSVNYILSSTIKSEKLISMQKKILFTYLILMVTPSGTNSKVMILNRMNHKREQPEMPFLQCLALSLKFS